MKKIVVLFIALIAVFPIGVLNAAEGHDHDGLTEQVAMTTMYVCPMHADVKSNEPGECPKCGMTLKQIENTSALDEASQEKHDHSHHEHHE